MPNQSGGGHPPRERVLLGLGANLGAPLQQLQQAVELLSDVVAVSRTSSVYRTAPVGHLDQPDFYNLVVDGEALAPPAALLDGLLGIERALGRVRYFANGPRTIDIDLLAYGDRVQDGPALVLPHPRLHLRRFVLAPLAEIAPGWRHPVLGLTARELLSALPPGERVERVAAPEFRRRR